MSEARAGRLHGKLAVVTGASSGIGAALARALATEGARVVGFARRFAAPRLSTLPEPGEIAEVALDLRDESAILARFAELPEIDVLVNNAGAFHTGAFIDFGSAELRELMDVHVVAAFLCAQQALRKMAPRRRGHLVFVSSVAVFNTFAGCAAYTAAKEAQKGLVRVLVEEARAHDVRVTGLFPGGTDTAAWAGAGVDPARLMKPEALADLVIEVVVRPELSVELLAVMPPGGSI